MRRRRYTRFQNPVCAFGPEDTEITNALELDPGGNFLLMPTARMCTFAADLAAPLFDAEIEDDGLIPDVDPDTFSAAVVVAGLLDAFRAQRELLRRLATDPTDTLAVQAARDYLANGLAGTGERGTVSAVLLNTTAVETEMLTAVDTADRAEARARARSARTSCVPTGSAPLDPVNNVIPLSR